MGPHRPSLGSPVVCPKRSPLCAGTGSPCSTPVTDASVPARETQLAHGLLSAQVWAHLLRGALMAVVCVTGPHRPCDSVVFLPLCWDVHSSELISGAPSKITTLASRDPAGFGSTSQAGRSTVTWAHRLPRRMAHLPHLLPVGRCGACRTVREQTDASVATCGTVGSEESLGVPHIQKMSKSSQGPFATRSRRVGFKNKPLMSHPFSCHGGGHSGGKAGPGVGRHPTAGPGFVRQH